MGESTRTDPLLWEAVKAEITGGAKGGRPGQWSARKAQMAVQEYRRRGGGYEEDGLAQDETSLHLWTEEAWGTGSGGESGRTGERYLPYEVRLILTEREYARTSRAKREGEGQFVRQPGDIAGKAAKIRRDGPTLGMLRDRAADLGIEGRSGMAKADLLAAIEEATDANGRAKDPEVRLGALTRDRLMEMARDRDIPGRSGMTKAELIAALTG